jgi:hypothetical protein
VRPASPDGPPWVVLGAKAVEALGALHGEGWPPWPNRLGGNRMKKLTGSQLFGGARARKTKARIARAQLLMAAARERAGGRGWRPSVLTECGSGDGPAQIKPAQIKKGPLIWTAAPEFP